jgi:hypothetical protein
MESQRQAIEQWKRSAQREDREGHPALAITFRNMAWLVENSATWLPHVVKSAGEQALDYVESIKRVASDWDNIP